MDTIVLDFETYWADDFSLRGMSTQEYITDDRFQVIGVGVQWADGTEPYWATGYHIAEVMNTLRRVQDDAIVVCHNAAFDGAILSWHYGVTPGVLVDTMSMAKSLGLQSTVGGSLSKLATQMQEAGIKVPSKGTEAVNAKNKRWEDFTAEQLHSYGQYCKDDVRITRTLYNELVQYMTQDELLWQSVVLKMYTEPLLRVNGGVVADELQRVQERRAAAAQRLATSLGFEDQHKLVSIINSNPKFAEALQLFGAEVPMKTSDTTGKPTFALGIKDEGFLALQDHPVLEVRELVMARMGLKSSIEESRCEAMLWQAEFEKFPTPYRVSGARTHRLGGGEGGDEDGAERTMKRGKVNVQNLPSGRIKGQSKALREAIGAPTGYALISADSSQVEVRVIDYMANDAQGIQDHSTGVCPYSSLAVRLYGEGEPAQIKRDAKKGIEPWASRRQMSKSARLSLQFGSGAEGFRLYCKASGVTITPEEAEFYKSGFRKSKPALVAFWALCGRVLGAMLRGESGHFGGTDGRLFFYDGARTVIGQHIPGIRLPDGVWVSYPSLEQVEGKYGLTYRSAEKQGRKTEYVYLHGAKVAQQLTQATAFGAMKWYAVQTQHKIVLNSHDEHVLCVPLEHADAAAAELESLMKTAPPWAPGLPLDCEVHRGFNYGELK